MFFLTVLSACRYVVSSGEGGNKESHVSNASLLMQFVCDDGHIPVGLLQGENLLEHSNPRRTAVNRTNGVEVS